MKPQRSPKVSVAIVTYNHERFIAQTLESILAQRCDFAVEIVVGEDSSSDTTRSIVEAYRARYPDRIRLLPTAGNVGMTVNSTTVLRACRGEYIAICNGDDYWSSPTKLAAQVALLDSRKDLAICHSLAEWFAGDGLSDEQLLEVHPTDPGHRRDDDGRRLRKGCYITTSSSVIRREFIPDFEPSFVSIGVTDWPLFLLVAQHGSIGFLDEVTTRYRIHPGNSFRTWSFARQMEIVCRTYYYLARYGAPHERGDFARRGNASLYSAIATLPFLAAVNKALELAKQNPLLAVRYAAVVRALVRRVAIKSYRAIWRRQAADGA